MNKLIFSLAIFSISMTAKADLTRFQSLQETYKTATKAALSDFNGAYAGRCFYSNISVDPNDAMGMVLITKDLKNVEKPGKNDGGPLFPTVSPVLKNEQRAYVYQIPQDDHFRFDNLTSDMLNKLKQDDPSRQIKSSFLSQDNSSVFWTSKYDSGNSIRADVRKSGNYLILKVTALIDLQDDRGTLIQHAGDNAAMCYFFKKIW